MTQILRVIDEQSQSTWADNWEYISYYNWTGEAGSLSPPVPNSGNGEPKLANGLVACSHRPSDDLCVFNYITSDNAMMSVELDNVADVLDMVGSEKNLSTVLRGHAKTIRQPCGTILLLPMASLHMRQTDMVGNTSWTTQTYPALYRFHISAFSIALTRHIKKPNPFCSPAQTHTMRLAKHLEESAVLTRTLQTHGQWRTYRLSTALMTTTKSLSG